MSFGTENLEAMAESRPEVKKTEVNVHLLRVSSKVWNDQVPLESKGASPNHTVSWLRAMELVEGCLSFQLYKWSCSQRIWGAKKGLPESQGWPKVPWGPRTGLELPAGGGAPEAFPGFLHHILDY